MRNLAVIGVLLIALTAMSVVAANPPGIPSGYKKVFQFNLIGVPKTYTGGCGNGARIFVDRGAAAAKVTVYYTATGGWDILNCNGSGSNVASLQNPDMGTFVVYARILGKPGGSLTICADILVDQVSQETLCALDTFSLTRSSGKSTFKPVPNAIFATALYNVLWTIETNTGFRIAQFRIYQVA
jgi:hypothetical protein